MLVLLCMICALVAVGLAMPLSDFAARPQRHMLQVQEALCDFRPVNNYTHYKYTDLPAGLNCLQRIKLNYDVALGQVVRLALAFREYYVYIDIAKDPSASVQYDPFRFPVFSEKVDLVGELRDLALSLPKGEPVALPVVHLQVTELFNRLRDAHVLYTGMSRDGTPGAVFGGVLDSFAVMLWDTAMDTYVESFAVHSNGTATGMALFNNGVLRGTREINSIDGVPIVEWVTSVFAKEPYFPLPFKSLGSRVNQFLQQVLASGATFPLATLGNIARIANQTYHVQYTDGGESEWKWVLTTQMQDVETMIPVFNEVANKPGAAFQAITNGIQAYAEWMNATKARFIAIITASNNRSQPAVLFDKHASKNKSKPSNTIHRHLITQPAGTATPAPQTYVICCDFIGQTIGEYSVLPNQLATIKLKTFWFDPYEFQKAWQDLVVKATAANVSNLIFDVTSNGGGYVLTALLAGKALYPGIEANQFDRIIGPAARFLINSGLEIHKLNRTIKGLTRNTDWLATRAKYLSSNLTALRELVDESNAIFKFISTMFDSSAQTQTMDGCLFDSEDCRTMWAKLKQDTADFRAIIEKFADKGHVLSPKMLSEVLVNFLEALTVVNPYIINEHRRNYLKPTYYVRGGHNNSYTQKFELVSESELFLSLQSAAGGPLHDDDAVLLHTHSDADADSNSLFPDLEELSGVAAPSFGTVSAQIPSAAYNRTLRHKAALREKLPPHPFTKILAVGNGLCGSACDQFSRSAWLYSLTHPDSPTFKYVTYGGTGRPQDISPTVFPGGNVVSTDYMSQSWAYYGLLETLAHWTEHPQLVQQASEFGKKLPVPPPGLQLTPQYSQSEMYQHEMGPEALPMEFYVIPTDYYIPKWYRDAQGWDKWAMYSDASVFFDVMPGPGAPERLKSWEPPVPVADPAASSARARRHVRRRRRAAGL